MKLSKLLKIRREIINNVRDKNNWIEMRGSKMKISEKIFSWSEPNGLLCEEQVDRALKTLTRLDLGAYEHDVCISCNSRL